MGLLTHTVWLGLLWVLLSGHFTALTLGLGLTSTILVALISMRMNQRDGAAYTLQLRPMAVILYFGWLLVEIVLSNLAVCGRILRPDMKLQPTVRRVKSTQKTRVGQVIFANSITLTPGTVSINLWNGEIRIHALTKEAAELLGNGDMDRRVTSLEYYR